MNVDLSPLRERQFRIFCRPPDLDGWFHSLASCAGSLGVLACTNHRLLFLFAGLIRRQFLQVNWNQAKAIIYNQTTKTFAVYTTKPTKRAIPAMVIRIANLTDAQTVAEAARTAAAAPRLDIK